ncbi:MAG: adenylate kinase [Rhabdochlamydiaceae bacterium]|nr:adenylate kinase [Rhabdochlamydiaceae bacterium]
MGSVIGAEKNSQVIILLGAPASGKGTQAKFIAKELNIPHISTGDLFRENIKNKTKLGLEAQTTIQQGKLVSDTLVLDMLFSRIAQPDAQKGYLLDGFPRTVPQAQAYEKHIGNLVKLIAINIEVPDSILLERIASRQKAEGRVDDTQEIAKERLKVYQEQTAPLIAFYGSQGILHKVQGNTSIEDVQKQIMSILNKK